MHARRYHECQMIRDYINAASKYHDENWIEWANDAAVLCAVFLISPRSHL
jgi:hypothetical protein